MTKQVLTHERFFDVASRFADRPFVGTPPSPERRWEPAGLSYTYAQGAARIEELARVYRDAGVGHGHRVATEIENHPDYFLHKLALCTLGAAIVPLNPDLKPPELAWALELTRPELVLVMPHLRASTEAGAAELGSHAPQLVDFGDFDRGLPNVRRKAPASGPVGRDTETLVLFTSGTTGRSKGCRYSHDYEVALGNWYGSMGGMADLRPGLECVYNPLPVYHSDCGIRAFHEMMPIGGATFTSDRFRPTRFWDEVRASEATVIHYLGIVTTFLMAQPERPSDRQHQVRFGLGAGVEPGRQDYFEKRFGFPLLEMWGMTECMRVLCDSLPPRTLGKRAVGRPRPGLDVKLVDENDHQVPTGTQGEMCIRHSAATPRQGLFSGYLDDPGRDRARLARRLVPHRRYPAGRTRAAASTSWTGRRTSSAARARTSPPWRWKVSSVATRASPSARSSRSRTSCARKRSSPVWCQSPGRARARPSGRRWWSRCWRSPARASRTTSSPASSSSWTTSPRRRRRR